MVARIPGLDIGDGGVYFLSASQGVSKSKSKYYKIGMSKRNLLDRINSYGVCFPRVNLAAVIVVKRQAKQDQPNIALNLEKFIHAVLDSWGKFKTTDSYGRARASLPSLASDVGSTQFDQAKGYDRQRVPPYSTLTK